MRLISSLFIATFEWGRAERTVEVDEVDEVDQVNEVDEGSDGECECALCEVVGLKEAESLLPGVMRRIARSAGSGRSKSFAPPSFCSSPNIVRSRNLERVRKVQRTKALATRHATTRYPPHMS